MDTSLKGHYLPTTRAEFDTLDAEGRLKFPRCLCCGKSHHDRCHTAAGWRESQISGFCEECFDSLFEDDE